MNLFFQDSSAVAGAAAADTTATSGSPSAQTDTTAASDAPVWFEGLPDDLTATDLAWMGARVVVLLVATLILIRIIDRVARASMRQFEDLPHGNPRKQRATTLAALFSSTARYLLWPAAVVLILTEFGFNLNALLATAGIAGIALGFGAQTLVRDVIAGFFLLFDDTVHVGDVITVNGQEGIIEDIGLRLIKMRRFNGELVMIPAGELRIFGNRSIDFARVVCEVDTAYEADINQVTDALGEIAAEWSETNRSIMLDEEPEVHSVLRLTDSSVRLRVVVRVLPGEQWIAERSMLKLIKQRFDERGIEIPFPRRTVYMRPESAGESSPES
ncbi:MAG: mechanosensitive ion channel family protein [Rhodothermales bacterium]|nr:mechanosensitive ion channel family protein [Rhodothermales bacterium]MBO6780319.1 mechanosensitive ion channel family protein [Rhodothermales bacterium]